jgi:hypothetical protein
MQKTSVMGFRERSASSRYFFLLIQDIAPSKCAVFDILVHVCIYVRTSTTRQYSWLRYHSKKNQLLQLGVVSRHPHTYTHVMARSNPSLIQHDIKQTYIDSLNVARVCVDYIYIYLCAIDIHCLHTILVPPIIIFDDACT